MTRHNFRFGRLTFKYMIMVDGRGTTWLAQVAEKWNNELAVGFQLRTILEKKMNLLGISPTKWWVIGTLQLIMTMSLPSWCYKLFDAH